MARLTTLLFAMWLGVTVSTVVDLEKRIIGIQQCGPKERLHHVQLKTKNDGKYTEVSCGGTLISDRWILTAAHCFEPGGWFVALIGELAGPKAVQIKDPPEFFHDGKEHDLMLLKLPKAVVEVLWFRLQVPRRLTQMIKDQLCNVLIRTSSTVRRSEALCGGLYQNPTTISMSTGCVAIHLLWMPLMVVEEWCTRTRFTVSLKCLFLHLLYLWTSVMGHTISGSERPSPSHEQMQLLVDGEMFSFKQTFHKCTVDVIVH